MNIEMLAGEPGTLLLGGMAMAALGLMAVYGSNRLQRQVSSSIAHCIGRFQTGRRRQMSSLASRLERAHGLDQFFDELPWIVSRAAGVTPVTLFLLEGDAFAAARSTRLAVRPEPVPADDPLALMLGRCDSVHYLRGRSDDLQNAPIHAVNGPQLDACHAVAAIPLKRGGSLVGFLLCGGPGGSPQPVLASMSDLDWVARLCREALEACRGPWAGPIEKTSPEAKVSSAPAIVLDRTQGRIAVLDYEGNERMSAEPQLAGIRGGYETTD